MSDLEKILWTSFATIIGGLIVFVLGQILSKFFLEPIQELWKAISEVRFNLAYYAATIHTPPRDKASGGKAHDAITKNWADLLTKVDAIPLYKWLPSKFFIPIKDIEKAATHLRGLATHLYESDAKAEANIEEVNRRVTRIQESLRLRPLA